MSKSITPSTDAELPPREPILRRKIWDRLHEEDKNYMAIVCGPTGSGKSEFGLRLCERIDPNFSPDRVAFTIEEFMRLVNERHKPGSAILFDEVGIALSHAKHYEDDVIRVNHILQSWREQNRMLVMTAPHIGLIHKPDRGLLHAQMDMQTIDRQRYLAHARYRNIQQNTDDGALYKKYPRLRDPDTGQRRIYQGLALFKPTPSLVEPYLKKKREFNDALNQEVLDSVTPDEADERLTPQEAVEQIVANDNIREYVSQHSGNGREYVDADLIRHDFGLSQNDARQAKKALEREWSSGD